MRIKVLALTAVSLLWTAAAARAQAPIIPASANGITVDRIDVGTSANQPSHLTDGSGRSLYMFQKDVGMNGSACEGTCAQMWPPALGTPGSVSVGQNVDKSKLGSIQRPDGTSQLTYDGKPLYFYVKDTGPGQVSGQDVQGFGAAWYLVSPDGSKVGP